MGGQDAALDKEVRLNLGMGDSMYQTAAGALKAGTDYTTGAYKMGGFDQSAKYSALQSGILDALNRKGPGDFLNPQELGSSLAMRAEAISSVGAERVKAGMDEMMRIRSTLAGNGLQTTNFAQAEGATGVQAAAQMDFNPTMSTINAIGGLASTVYGGFKNASKSSSPPPSQFGFGTQGGGLSNWATTPITSLMSPGRLGFTGR